MNKQEAIEEIKKQSTQAYDDFAIIRDTAISIINQINEPEKPVVPQYVADLYESIKDDFEDKLYELCLQFNNDSDDLPREIWWWFDCGKNEPIQTLVKMKIYGYEVEEEKLYTVELPNPNDGEHPVLFKNRDGKVSIIFPSVPCWREVKNAQLTEAEIKKDFEWAWQFAKEVEE